MRVEGGVARFVEERAREEQADEEEQARACVRPRALAAPQREDGPDERREMDGYMRGP